MKAYIVQAYFETDEELVCEHCPMYMYCEIARKGSKLSEIECPNVKEVERVK